MATNPVTDTFTATGTSGEAAIRGKANILITGGVGTVQLQKSHDQGATWQVVSRDSAGTDAEYTTAGDTAFNGTVDEPEFGILYRFECTAYTSGTITVRIASRPLRSPS